MADDPAAVAAKAAKDARKAMLLTLFAVAVAVAVLAIDNSIKRAIVAEAQRIQGMIRGFEEHTDGLSAAIQGRTGDLPADGVADPGGGSVADDPAARPSADGDAAAGRAAGSRGRSGSRPRP